MRNPLAHFAPHAPTASSFRERLAGYRDRLATARDKAARMVAVNRIMVGMDMGPPKPAPVVDRLALINYATWLFQERRLVCLELYPNAGLRATATVHGDVAAETFHVPSGGDWRALPQPSTRAVETLDRLGIDWRADRDRSSWADDRPASADAAPLPHGGPRLDAALLEALDDLTRLDAAIEALHSSGDATRSGGDVAGYDELDAARDGVLARLTKERAESLTGLQAKARALRTDVMSNSWSDERDQLVDSLCRDLLGLKPAGFELRPDPIFALIEEARQLDRAHDALFCARTDGNPSEKEDEAHRSLWAFVRGPLLKTPPRTAEGCKALAGFVCAFERGQGVGLIEHESGQDDPVLALIARSPLL